METCKMCGDLLSRRYVAIGDGFACRSCTGRLSPRAMERIDAEYRAIDDAILSDSPVVFFRSPDQQANELAQSL